MTNKFTYIFLCFLSPIFLQWCHANDDADVFDYIFGDEEDDPFALPKREEEVKPIQEPPKETPPVVQEPPKEAPPNPKPVKESKEEPPKQVHVPVKKPEKEANMKKSKKTEEKVAEDVGFGPLADFLKLGMPELEKQSQAITTGTEDGSADAPLADFLRVGQASLKPKKKRKRKKRRRYILRQMGDKSPPQALKAFGSVIHALSQSVKALKFAVDGSTNMSRKTVETVGGANNSTLGVMQTMLEGTSNATRRQLNSWADTLDMLRKSMSGSVNKKKDKGHSITITTTSDAPVKTLASFVDKWGNGGGLTGQKPASKPVGIAGLPIDLPEVSSVDFSDFWK